MHLIYLKEGRRYAPADLVESVRYQIERSGRPYDGEAYGLGFFMELRDAMNRDKESVVRGERSYVFHYIGLFDFVDSKGKNLTFFFLPKFLNVWEGDECEPDDDRKWVATEQSLESWQKCIGQWQGTPCDDILLAVDRFNKDEARLGDETEIVKEHRESLLELAVRVLRDYLENGLYIVHRNEFEIHGAGEINWEATIERCDPLFVHGDPMYVDYLTEQTYSDEDYYITRLHKCLLTQWGEKLEALGLAPVLRVNVPLLSEEQVERLGDAEYQVAQIDRELKQQFVSKSRDTLMLMRSLILRTSETKAVAYESLSFGMSGVEHLWEAACARVLGSELEDPLRRFGLHWEDKDDRGQMRDMSDVHFDRFMPRIIWRGPNNEREEFDNKKGSQRSKKAGWRLDFIRTYPPHVNDTVKAEKLVILDAKYYCARWEESTNGGYSISGQPGTPDITKQMYYQMVFQDLQEQNAGLEMVNAFLLPEDDLLCPGEEKDGNLPSVWKSETVGWSRTVKAFKDIHLYTVRIPGMCLISRYAHGQEPANDWFEKIVRFGSPTSATKVVSVGHTDESSAFATVVEKSEQVAEDENPLETMVEEHFVPPIDFTTACISKAFIRDVVSVPSVSCKEGMMKAYIRQFAEARGVECHSDKKGNLYLTKGLHSECYPCLVNHMDTVQEKQAAYVDRNERLEIRERTRDDKTELYVEGMGIGADNKLGCAIALALIDQLPVVKAAFFVEEEKFPGMLGSKELDVAWFSNVGFCLSFDSPERNRSSRMCNGELLYSEEFFEKILKPIANRHGVTEFKSEPYTDVAQIRQKMPIMCWNLGNGGYNPHSPTEYLVVEDAQASFLLGKELLEKIGTNAWKFEQA